MQFLFNKIGLENEKSLYLLWRRLKEFLKNTHPTDSNWSLGAGYLFNLGGGIFLSPEAIREPVWRIIQEIEFTLFMRQSAPEEWCLYNKLRPQRREAEI